MMFHTHTCIFSSSGSQMLIYKKQQKHHYVRRHMALACCSISVHGPTSREFCELLNLDEAKILSAAISLCIFIITPMRPNSLICGVFLHVFCAAVRRQLSQQGFMLQVSDVTLAFGSNKSSEKKSSTQVSVLLLECNDGGAVHSSILSTGLKHHLHITFTQFPWWLVRPVCESYFFWRALHLPCCFTHLQHAAWSGRQSRCAVCWFAERGSNKAVTVMHVADMWLRAVASVPGHVSPVEGLDRELL